MHAHDADRSLAQNKPFREEAARASGFEIVPVREQPGIIEQASAWFASKWDVAADEYRTSMDACCAAGEGGAAPQWYVALDDGKIVAGAGVIDNDFHTRPDLTPNICAVYVEPERRRQGIARALLDFVCNDMAERGIAQLFLLTDHDGFYERMGWRFREMVRDNDGAMGRMYEKETTAAGGRATESASEPSPKPLSDATRIAENRLNWDDRAEVHAASEFYEVEKLIADPAKVSGTAQRDYNVLRPHLPENGLAGASVLHLQCHIGTDTLSWVRLGAREVWGLDFSPASLDHARRIARRAGANVTYVQGDARHAADIIDRSFDVVVTGTGAICWLPDLGDWAHSIARLLVPGGVFLLRDDHPLLDALAYEGMTVTEDYLSGTGSIDYEDDGSYTENSEGAIAHTANHNWRHDFQEILGSLLEVGLVIEGFHELPYAEWHALPFLERTNDVWTMPKGMPLIPLCFAVVARKPRVLP